MTASTALSSKQCTVYQPGMREIRQFSGNQTLGLCGVMIARQLSVFRILHVYWTSGRLTIDLLPNVFTAAEPKVTFSPPSSIQPSEVRQS